MKGKRAFCVAILLAFFFLDGVDCRQSRGRGRRRSRGRQVQEAEDFQARDFQQSQDIEELMPQQVMVDGSKTVPLELPGLRQSSTSQQTQQRSQSLISSGDCRIEYDSVSSRHYHPMIMRPDNKGLLYPDMEGEDRIIWISSGKTTFAACPGPENYLLLNGYNKAYINCKKGQLYYGKTAVHWNQLGCWRKLKPNINKGASGCGSSASSSSSSKTRIHTVEWPIRRGVVIPQIIFCFDESQETVLYTHHQVHGRNIDAKIVEPSRPSFKRKNMFTVSANTVYSKREQKALFTDLLENPDHLTAKKQHYLARGHLAPDSDFVLEPEQDATYLYANVVPQWQAVNNGNWKSLEYSIRDLAKDHQATLDIWTGVHGILHLPNSRNDPVELFLGLSVDRRVIPVPALLWKVVHDPLTRSAVAIVEVNDVRGYGTGRLRSDSLYEPPCHDLCGSMSWVDWDVLDHTSGRTFCCSVADLRRAIPNVPDLGRVSILSS